MSTWRTQQKKQKPNRRGLSDHDDQNRRTLFHAWREGFVYAGGTVGAKRKDEISPIAYTFFNKFIEAKHPNLVLSPEEQALNETMRNPVSPELVALIEDRLPTGASQLGMHPHVMRAILHGLAVGRQVSKQSNDVASLYRDASKVVLEILDKDPAMAGKK